MTTEVISLAKRPRFARFKTVQTETVRLLRSALVSSASLKLALMRPISEQTSSKAAHRKPRSPRRCDPTFAFPACEICRLAAVSENLRPFQGNEPASHHLFQFR